MLLSSEVQQVRHRVEIAPKTIFLVLGIVAGVWLVSRLTDVISVMVIALVLVGTLDPLVAWLERRGLGRGRSLVLVFITASIALVGVILLMVPPLLAQLLRIIEGAPQARVSLIESLRGYSWAKPLVNAVQDVPLDNLVASSGKHMIGYSTTLFVAVGFGISTLFLAIYLLADPARSKGMLYSVVPRHHHVKLAKIVLELRVIVGGYMRGQLITSLSIGVFVFVLLKILGVDNALPLALFAGLTDIIPFVGGYVASAPVIAAVIPQGGATTIVVVLIMIVYQEFESRILVPRVYGRVLRLPPAVVLVALLVGGTLAGILGALLALPIAAGLQMLVRELRVDLPGAMPATEELLRRDDNAVAVYEGLSEGTTAAEAGVIADGVATMVRAREKADAELALDDAGTAPKGDV